MRRSPQQGLGMQITYYDPHSNYIIIAAAIGVASKRQVHWSSHTAAIGVALDATTPNPFQAAATGVALIYLAIEID